MPKCNGSRRSPKFQTDAPVETSALYFQRSRDDGPHRTITVRVPLRLHRRGGRKVVVTPAGAIAPISRQPTIDNALVKAIARAHRWRHMLESGQYASTAELANSEEINQSYLCRILRLTLLAPAIVEAVINGYN